MATFYGGVSGNRGDATRQGSKDSGMRVYAQSYESRITVNYGSYQPHDADEEQTFAHVTLGGGWTTYYRDRTISFNPDAVAKALDSGDPRMARIWERIQTEFDRLDAEAPKAIKRAERARKRAAAHA